MNKLTHGATRLLVLAFGLGLALTGWAAVKPLVVWNGDFPTSNDGTSTRNGYRLSAPRITTMTATGGVSGDPVFTSVEKLRGATMEVFGNSVELVYKPSGMALIFR